MEANQAKFEGWAIVELFGHQREAGFVTTQYYGNAAMFQLDVPELPEREYILERADWVGNDLVPIGSTVKKEAVAGRSRLINPSAVYALNPCDEAGVRKALETGARREIKLVKLAEGKQLVAAGTEADDYEGEMP
jgi:hypothetical protein